MLRFYNLKLIGSRDFNFYQIEQIKRIRLEKRADGYYVQFCVDVDRREEVEPSKTTIGLDVGLSYIYTYIAILNGLWKRTLMGCASTNPKIYKRFRTAVVMVKLLKIHVIIESQSISLSRVVMQSGLCFVIGLSILSRCLVR
jgi:hypothetical protein